MSSTARRWVVTAQKDPESGDLFLPVPDEVLECLGVEVGDSLGWDIVGDGSAVIRKAEPDETES